MEQGKLFIRAIFITRENSYEWRKDMAMDNIKRWKKAVQLRDGKRKSWNGNGFVQIVMVWREGKQENLIKTFFLRLALSERWQSPFTLTPFRKLLFPVSLGMKFKTSPGSLKGFFSSSLILLSLRQHRREKKPQKMIHNDAYHVTCCFWQQKDMRNVHQVLILNVSTSS